MASPTFTGGAGIHLESWIAAYYLATTLLGGAARGLPSGAIATAVTLQRAYQGKPLPRLPAGQYHRRGLEPAMRAAV